MSMTVGFDYWQVLSHYPDSVGQLMDALERAGHDVLVISTIGRDRLGTVEAEARQLGFGGPVYEVVFEHPRESPDLKLAKCQELGVTMFFDDRDDVCRLLSKNGIVAMRVTRKDNRTYDLQAERDSARLTKQEKQG